MALLRLDQPDLELLAGGVSAAATSWPDCGPSTTIGLTGGRPVRAAATPALLRQDLVHPLGERLVRSTAATPWPYCGRSGVIRSTRTLPGLRGGEPVAPLRLAPRTLHEEAVGLHGGDAVAPLRPVLHRGHP